MSKLICLLWSLSVVCLASAACGWFGTEPDRFVIPVDSITAPDAIAATDPLPVRFWGRIGPDGCSRLLRAETARFPGALDVTFHGERSRGDCVQMPVPLVHDETIVPPIENPFTIRVHEPDGTVLSRTVSVR